VTLKLLEAITWVQIVRGDPGPENIRVGDFQRFLHQSIRGKHIKSKNRKLVEFPQWVYKMC